MDRRRGSRVVMALGLILLLISGLADALGLGQVSGFGWKQILGVVVGAVVIGIGWYLGRSQAR